MHDNGITKALLSVLWNGHETPIVGKLTRCGEGNVDDHRQADRMTSEGALSEAVGNWPDRV